VYFYGDKNEQSKYTDLSDKNHPATDIQRVQIEKVNNLG